MQFPGGVVNITESQEQSVKKKKKKQLLGLRTDGIPLHLLQLVSNREETELVQVQGPVNIWDVLTLDHLFLVCWSGLLSVILHSTWAILVPSAGPSDQRGTGQCIFNFG